MSQPQPVSTLPATAKPSAFTVWILGKIAAITDSKDYVYYEIACKAVDEYSLPPVVSVSSRRNLGRIGDEIEIQCRVGGYPRKGNNTRFITNTLTAIE